MSKAVIIILTLVVFWTFVVGIMTKRPDTKTIQQQLTEINNRLVLIEAGMNRKLDPYFKQPDEFKKEG